MGTTGNNLGKLKCKAPFGNHLRSIVRAQDGILLAHGLCGQDLVLDQLVGVDAEVLHLARHDHLGSLVVRVEVGHRQRVAENLGLLVFEAHVT